jgi:5-formyltetrahydrofolate cyclo-ligase
LSNRPIKLKDLTSVDVKLYTPYLPAPNLDTITSLPGSGKPGNVMRMLRLYSQEDLAACPLDKWGILDPGEYRRDTGEKRHDGMPPCNSTVASSTKLTY